jgi:hypothetical protein
MLRLKSLAIIGVLTLATAACGDRPVDRALTGGAAIGAATAPRQYYYLISHRPQAIAAASCM